MNSKEKQIAIKAENITKVFGDFTAVDHISFEVKRRNIRFSGRKRCRKNYSDAHVLRTFGADFR